MKMDIREQEKERRGHVRGMERKRVGEETRQREGIMDQ